jgi:hypothetical protein
MREVLDDLIRQTLQGFGQRLAEFGPNLLAMLLILAVGLLAAGVVRFAVRFVLPRLGFDRFAQRAGIALVLQKGGILSAPSAVVALVLAWGLLAVFMLLAIGALDVQIARELVGRAFAYLPQVLIAVTILVLGALVAAFVRRSVLIAAVNAGLPSARLLAGAAHAGLMVLFTAMALEHVGVGRQVILVSFAILFGGAVFAISLSLGLAGRDLAREFLERVARGRPEGDDDLRHL